MSKIMSSNLLRKRIKHDMEHTSQPVHHRQLSSHAHHLSSHVQHPSSHTHHPSSHKHLHPQYDMHATQPHISQCNNNNNINMNMNNNSQQQLQLAHRTQSTTHTRANVSRNNELPQSMNELRRSMPYLKSIYPTFKHYNSQQSHPCVNELVVQFSSLHTKLPNTQLPRPQR